MVYCGVPVIPTVCGQQHVHPAIPQRNAPASYTGRQLDPLAGRFLPANDTVKYYTCQSFHLHLSMLTAAAAAGVAHGCCLRPRARAGVTA